MRDKCGAFMIEKKEQQPVVSVQQLGIHSNDTVAGAAVVATPSPRWLQHIPLLLAYAGFIGLGLVSSRLGVTWTPMRATFAMPMDAVGVLLMAQLAGAVVVSAFSGRLTAWLNIGVMSAFSCAIMAVALLGSGVISSWGLLVALSLLTGIGAGMIESSLNTYAATYFNPRAMNWLHACWGVGATLGLALMTAIVAGDYNWQVGFIALGIFELLLALGFGLTRRYWRTPAPMLTPSTRGRGAPLKETLRLPVAWLGILFFVAFSGVQGSAGQWFYTLLTEDRNVSAALAGTWVSIFWASLTVGRIVFGFVVQHVPPMRILWVCIGGVLVSTIVFTLNFTSLLSFSSIALLGLGLAPLYPLLTSATPQYLGSRHAANGVGLQVAAAGLGGVLVTSLVGVLAQTFGLAVIAPALVLSAVAMVLLFQRLARHIAA